MKLDEGAQVPLGVYEAARSWLQRKLQEYAREINKRLQLVGGTLTGALVSSASSGTPVTIVANNVAGPNLRLTNAGAAIASEGDTLGTVEFYSDDQSANSSGVFGKVGVFNEFSGSWDGTASRVDTYMSLSTAADGVLAEAMRLRSDGAILGTNLLRLRNAGSSIASADQSLGDVDFYSNDASSNSTGVFGRVRVANASGVAWDGTASRVDTYMALSTTKDGTLSEVVRLSDGGDLHAHGQVRATGWYNKTTLGTLNGLGVEMGISSGEGYVLAFDRGVAAYGNMNVMGTEVALMDTAGAKRLRMIASTFDIVSRLTATPPTLGTNLEAVWNLTSDTNLRVSVRGSDGTTRTANITLA